MLLATRCPHCATLFRLDPALLEQRAGLARCGCCQRVFDAGAALEPYATSGMPSTGPIPAAGLAGMMSEPITAPARPAAASAALGTNQSPDTANAREPHFSFPDTSEAAPPLPYQAARHEPTLADTAHLAADGAQASALRRNTRAAPHRVARGLVVLLLLTLAMLALGWVERAALIEQWPTSQIWIARATALLGGRFEPPRALHSLRLGATRLQQLEHAQLELSTTLENHANIAVAYPSLELTLLDAAEQPLASRTLAPSDYLDAARPVAAGLPAGTTVSARALIAADQPAVTHFRLRIFYP